MTWLDQADSRDRLLRERLVAFGLIVFVIAADQLTKYLVESSTARLPWSLNLLGCEASISLYRNSGAFLSMGSALGPWARVVLVAVVPAVVSIVALRYIFSSGPSRPLQRVCFSLVAAGAIGNLIDRLTRGGEVTDFLFVGCGPVRTGVFNVADMALTAAALVLIFDLAWYERRAARA